MAFDERQVLWWNSCLVTDGYVNAIVASGEIGSSTLGVSATTGFFYSNAERVDQLAGLSQCCGGGGSWGILTGGAEYCAGAVDNETWASTGVWSISEGGGLGKSIFPVDGHIGASQTWVKTINQYRSYPGEEEHWDSCWNPFDEGQDPTGGGDDWDSWWNPWA